MRERLVDALVAVLAGVLGIGGAVIALWAAGFAPGAVLGTWFHAALGSRSGWAQSLEEACPLLLTGLATAVAFRAGALSIGVDGQFRLGAAAFMAAALVPRGAGTLLAWTLCIAATAIAGAAWVAIAAALERWRQVPLVLSTILLNFVAQALVSWLVEVPLHDPTTSAPQTASLPRALELPNLMSGAHLHLGVLIAAALAGIAWLAQSRTVVGFELGVVGANPAAARLAGMRVDALRTGALLLSGALAGVAGGLQQSGVTHYLSDSSVSYGYAGIAVALLGRLHPIGVLLSAWFFGALDTGARGLERELSIPHDLGDILKGFVLLIALVAGSLRWRTFRAVSAPPGAAGVAPAAAAPGTTAAP